MAHLIGVDVGGTNTDLVFVDTETNELRVAKVPSTPANQADGLMHGIDNLGVPLKDVDLLIHGTTVATNAVIERKGARCGLITTKGFRDVLEMGRRDRRQMYGLFGDFQPLIDRPDRREVDERVTAQGDILTELDPDEVRAVAKALADDGCEALVISFMHSYANTTNEEAAGKAAREVWPNDFVVLSSEVLPIVREFERTSTATVSGYVQPLISRYLTRLSERLNEGGYDKDFLVVQLNGGVMTSSVAARLASNTILSGPAAGVTAGAAIAADVGIGDVVCCDMGGTSFDACIIRGGQPVIANEKYLDFRIPLSLPMLDVDAIGAGGGSIARIDSSGIIEVGPQSAGAFPGPACYGAKNDEPTVTDANLVLGYLNPLALADGTLPIQIALSYSSIKNRIAYPLGCSVIEAAYGIHTVANANMTRAVKAVTTYRGRDPRDFALFAFGGNGGVHAVNLARELRIGCVIIPPAAGVFSAVGLLKANMQTELTHAFMHPVADMPIDLAEKIFRDLENRVSTRLGQIHGTVVFQKFADVRYAGQAFELTVELSAGDIKEATILEIVLRFTEEHKRRYGHAFSGDYPLETVNLRVTGSITTLPMVATNLSETNNKDHHREVYFGPAFGTSTTSIIQRSTLLANPLRGPLIVEEYEGTTIIPHDCSARLDSMNNIVINLETNH